MAVPRPARCCDISSVEEALGEREANGGAPANSGLHELDQRTARPRSYVRQRTDASASPVHVSRCGGRKADHA